MGLSNQELQKVQNLNHEEVYKRIKAYYTNFMKRWQRMSNSEKSNHTMGSGWKAPVNYIDSSTTILTNLPDEPTLSDSIDLAKNVLSGRLEYSHHDQDKDGIKMGAYAKYIDTAFNGAKR